MNKKDKLSRKLSILSIKSVFDVDMTPKKSSSDDESTKIVNDKQVPLNFVEEEKRVDLIEVKAKR